MYKPPFIVLDYETVDDSGPSTEFWREDFRVISMAASWIGRDGSVKSDFMRGECAVEHFLRRTCGIPLVAHNIQFELGVSLCRFPEVQLAWAIDTMRLVQVFDNGGDKFAIETPLSIDDQLDALEGAHDDDAKPKGIAGLGLSKSVRRVLNERDHKERAYRWLRNNVAECKAGREGQFLDRLPPDELRAYNVGDTEACLKLFVHLVDYFSKIGYDYRLDHALYLSSVRRLVDAKIRGTRVERSKLEEYRRDVAREIEEIATEFRKRFVNEIATVERDRLLDQIKKRKTLRGKRGYFRRFRLGECAKDVAFNVGSNLQLQALFCDVLGIQPKFQTAKGAPSFRSAVLSQWGDGGEMLKKRRKRLLVLKQVESLLELSKVDGRFHVDLKACGTATGRFAGGSY